MTDILIWLSWPLLIAGVLFFVAGTFGIVRFTNVYSRLHAMTKADTLGLGLVIAGLALRSFHWQHLAIMLLIWLLVMAAGATNCQLLARYQQEHDDD